MRLMLLGGSALLFTYMLGTLVWGLHIHRKFHEMNAAAQAHLDLALTATRARDFPASQKERLKAGDCITAMGLAHADHQMAIMWWKLIGRWDADYLQEATQQPKEAAK